MWLEELIAQVKEIAVVLLVAVLVSTVIILSVWYLVHR